MIIEMNRKVPEYLKDGWALSSVPLSDMTNVEMAKAYAYELWRSRSMSDPRVNFILDEIRRYEGMQPPEISTTAWWKNDDEDCEDCDADC